MEAREAAMPGTRPGAAARERRHRGRKRDVFSGVSMAVATVVPVSYTHLAPVSGSV